MKKIGVVIVNYNDSINAIKLFEMLNRYECISEVVIVDNNSKEGYVKELRSYQADRLHTIYNSSNMGYAAALNKGAKYLNEKYKKDINIIFANTDIIVHEEETIIKLNNLINDEVKAGMVKVKEDGTFSYGWKLTSSFQDLICNIPLINKLYKSNIYYYKNNYYKNDVNIVDVVYGCFFIVDGQTLFDIGYFDENTFLYFEENILSRKLEKIAKKCAIDVSCYVTHAHNKTIGTNLSRYKKYKIYKKSQFYYEKEYNSANFFEMFFFKLFYYIRLAFLKITCLIKK